MIYFITFTCYGTHLHGAESGSVDRCHNHLGGRLLAHDRQRESTEQQTMNQHAYELDGSARLTVLETLRAVCDYRDWILLAAHVRSNHVHIIVNANVPPERVMNDFKSYSSRALNLLEHQQPERTRWTRHGSTRWLWNAQDVRASIECVIEKQGAPMAVFTSASL
jgi:REP element-mobilizing transposase RayT